jgi:hypothetical protein
MQKRTYDGMIYYYLRFRGYAAENAEWVVRQARNESGHYTSKAFVEDNNLFGMSCVEQRETTQIGCRDSADGVNTIGQYSSVLSSLKDRVLWDKMHGLTGKETTYPKDVAKKGYNRRANYVESVNAVKTELAEFKERAKRVFMVAVVGFTATAIYMVYKKKN